LDISNTLYTSGPIRGEAFQGLNSLEYLDIAENTYTSSIPLELSNLPKLEFLYMDNISFQGIQLTLDFMLPMKEIRELWMDGTKVEGGIPTEIGNLLSLASFSAANSSLTGGIPSEMGNLIFLDRLWLDQNLLTGRIPQEFGNLGRLSIFHVEGNQLSGSMPSEVCDIGAENEVEIGADCAAESSQALLECSCCTCCGIETCGDLN
jgi:Leucine-rich repeat (LRR) protein